MIRLVMALLLAATVATAQDWSTLGAFWVQPRGGATLGGAVDLDGSSEWFTKNVNFGASITSITYIVWVKPRVLSGAIGIMALQTNGVSKCGMYGDVNTNYQFNLVTDASSTRRAFSASQSRSTNWTMLVGVWDSGSAPILYFNGVPSNSITVANGSLLQTTVMQIGAVNASPWNGLQDTTAIFTNRSLGQSEISELYGSGTFPKSVMSLSTGVRCLAAHYSLDDGLTNPNASNALDSVSGTYATGTAIGVTNGNNDWVQGIVPQ